MDLQERSHQVSIMRLIYRKAQRTQVWLGVENKHTKRAFDLISRLARILDELNASRTTLNRGLDHENLVRRYRLDSGDAQADISAFMASYVPLFWIGLDRARDSRLEFMRNHSRRQDPILGRALSRHDASL